MQIRISFVSKLVFILFLLAMLSGNATLMAGVERHIEIEWSDIPQSVAQNVSGSFELTDGNIESITILEGQGTVYANSWQLATESSSCRIRVDMQIPDIVNLLKQTTNDVTEHAAILTVQANTGSFSIFPIDVHLNTNMVMPDLKVLVTSAGNNISYAQAYDNVVNANGKTMLDTLADEPTITESDAIEMIDPPNISEMVLGLDRNWESFWINPYGYRVSLEERGSDEYMTTSAAYLRNPDNQLHFLVGPVSLQTNPEQLLPLGISNLSRSIEDNYLPVSQISYDSGSLNVKIVGFAGTLLQPLTHTQPNEYVTYEDGMNKPSEWFGFYAHVDDLPLVGSYTNLNTIEPSMIEYAVDYEFYAIVDVTWQIFETDGENWSLKADWEAQLDTLVDDLAPYTDYIAAFTPIDEPYWNGVTQTELETAIAGIKARFPNQSIYLNFAWPTVLGLTAGTLGAGTDWLAFDKYSTNSGPIQMSEIQTYVNHLKSIKSSEQKLFLVPPSAMNIDNVTYTDQQLVETINAFYTLMQSDDEIIGMQVFLSDTGRQESFDGEGSTIPLAQAAQETIGLQIADNVCGDPWSGLYVFDYNNDCMVNLVDFAEFFKFWLTE